MKHKRTKLAPQLFQYLDGRVGIDLIEVKTGEPYLCATTNIMDAKLEEGFVFIKDYSENEGILNLLIKENVVEKPLRYVKTGMVEIPVCKLLI